MPTVVGMLMLTVWCACGFGGASIRGGKGYEPTSLASVLWGGPIYLVLALMLPPRRGL